MQTSNPYLLIFNLKTNQNTIIIIIKNIIIPRRLSNQMGEPAFKSKETKLQ